MVHPLTCRNLQLRLAAAIRLGYRLHLPTRGHEAIQLLTLTGDPLDEQNPADFPDLAAAADALLDGRSSSGLLEEGRWGTGARPGYSWERCRFCGHAGPDHARTLCRACGMPQCLKGDRCDICLTGYLRGVSYGLYGDDRQCGYKKCHEEAVTAAPRVRRVCREHLDGPTRRWGGQTIRLSEDITERVARLGQISGLRDYQIRRWFPEPRRGGPAAPAPRAAR
ncbi:hypothetical protein ABZ897_50630 [Nonomuraea sp. NPDC046802]|uniref:hypothetical protein n=1 Tax=Nonomuraea sp. NPDC046802 TaxID=3154919 RepID=UPI003410685E